MISMRTKYALKALIYLAKTRDRGPVLIGEIVESQKLPRKFLEQILLELKNLRVLKSKRGKAGGYYLAHHPRKITVGRIVRAFNGPLAWVPCVSAKAVKKCGECLDLNNCGIRRIMKKVRDATDEILDETSLEILATLDASESGEAAPMYYI